MVASSGAPVGGTDAPADRDRALLTRIADGDETALEELYRAYEGRVYGFALQRLKQPADAADVLNEVMLEVWKNAGRFEGRSRASSWILGIARFKTIDRLRARGVLDQYTDEVDDSAEDVDAPSPADVLSGVRDAEHLRYCMDRLSEAHREVVYLAFFEDLSYPEIARIVGCPNGTVKTRMLHAKNKLRLCLTRRMRQGDPS